MAGTIERRREVWQQQHDQQNQEQAADEAQIRCFWLKAKEGAGGRIAGNDTDISLIIPAFSSGFKAPRGLAPPELTKPLPSTIVPANSIGSSF